MHVRGIGVAKNVEEVDGGRSRSLVVLDFIWEEGFQKANELIQAGAMISSSWPPALIRDYIRRQKYVPCQPSDRSWPVLGSANSLIEWLVMPQVANLRRALPNTLL